MACKAVFGLAILSVAVLMASCATEVVVNPFHNEDPCNSEGGECMPKQDCPNEIKSSYLGLCPQQRAHGAECCHGISLKEYRCREFGGSCFPSSEKCPQELTAPRAKDCPAASTCCVLVS